MTIRKVRVKKNGKESLGPLASPDYESHFSSRQAAAFLGISKSEMLRRERLGILRPDFRDERGWRIYSLELLVHYKETLQGRVFQKDIQMLEALRVEQGKASENASAVVREQVKVVETVSSTVQEQIGQAKEVLNELQKQAQIPANQLIDNFTNQDAVRVFSALRDNKPLAEIVIEMQLHPAIVRKIHKEWIELQGFGLYISVPLLEQINKLPLEGTFPIETAEGLFENLKEIADAGEKCITCKRSVAAYCTKCHEAEKFSR
jgi:DNA-binding transcriptional MerR regulator